MYTELYIQYIYIQKGRSWGPGFCAWMFEYILDITLNAEIRRLHLKSSCFKNVDERYHHCV